MHVINFVIIVHLSKYIMCAELNAYDINQCAFTDINNEVSIIYIYTVWYSTHV